MNPYLIPPVIGLVVCYILSRIWPKSWVLIWTSAIASSLVFQSINYMYYGSLGKFHGLLFLMSIPFSLLGSCIPMLIERAATFLEGWRKN